MKLRILSYNIHKGFNWLGNKYMFEECVEALRRLNLDVLFLQEISGQVKSKKVRNNPQLLNNQLEQFAEKIFPHHAYGKNAVYPKGHHGNAILSRFEFNKWSNTDISTNPFEKRGVLYAKPSDLNIHFFCTHLNLMGKGRSQQIDKIIHAHHQLELKNAPMIFAGDFNDWNQTICQKLENRLNLKDAHKSQHGQLAKTFPSIKPVLCLDRIYLRNLKVTYAECLVNGYWGSFSDHSPLLIEVEYHQDKKNSEK